MNIAIIIAMQEELDAFLEIFPINQKTRLHNLPLWRVQYQTHQLYIIKCGIGKVNAAYATTTLLQSQSFDIVYNIGVAGGINIPHESIVIANQVVYHDVDVSGFSEYIHGQLPSMPPSFIPDNHYRQLTYQVALDMNLTPYLSTIASGDQFVINLESLAPILKHYPDIHAVEMEAAGIAQICHLERIPFVVIRAISDIIGDGKQNTDFSTFLIKASKQSAKLLKGVIDIL